MGFLTPLTAIIAAAIAVPLLVALYFLKLRRRLIDVSSTLLWRKAIEDLEVNTPFQKLRRNLLLILQLLILAALLIALARPTTRGVGDDAQRLVIVIDHSGSMNATDDQPTRLDRARQLALQLIDDLEGAAMVVTFAERARVVQPFTTDRALLRRAVNSVPPTDQRSRLAPALELIEPFTRRLADETEGEVEPLTVYVFSDARVHDADDLSLPGGEMRLVQLGAASEEDNEEADADTAPRGNLAIVSMSARRDHKRPQFVQVFAQVANFHDEPVETDIVLRVDGREQRRERRTIDAALPGTPNRSGSPGSSSLTFELELTGSALLEVRHEHDDQLSADNSAALVLAPRRDPTVMLVTKGNPFLLRAIQAAGAKRIETVTPQQFDALDPADLTATFRPDDSAGQPSTLPNAALGGVDLIVFDGHAPQTVPPIASLSFDAAPPIEGLELIKQPNSGVQYLLDWRRDDPVMRYVTLDNVLVEHPGRLVLPTGARVLATGQSGPIMAQVVVDDVPHVVAALSVLRSTWPMEISFAVFVDNVIAALASTGSENDALSFAPGDAAAVQTLDDDGDDVTYRGPVDLKADALSGRAVMPAFQRAGVYRLDDDNLAPPPWNTMAVNLTDPLESDLRPAPELVVRSGAVTVVTSNDPPRREVWRWFVLIALGVLVIEWVVYTRRMHV